MELNINKSLNAAFLKEEPNPADLNNFKKNIATLIESFKSPESEENHKNNFIKFLENTFYQDYYINTKDKIDLSIFRKAAKDIPLVLIESKRPSNISEMPSTDKLDSKALQELVLYFLRERITKNNLAVKHLIITNNNEFFIFDAKNFETNFAHDKKLVKNFEEFEQRHLSGTDTSFFYSEIASPKIIELEKEDKIECVYFKLSDYNPQNSQRKQ